MSKPLRALSAVLVAGLMYVALGLGWGAVAALSGAIVVLIALSWPWAAGIGGRRRAALVIAVAGAAGLALLLWPAGLGRATAILLALAVLVALTFVAQLARKDGRAGLIRDTAATIAGGAAGVVTLIWVTLADTLGLVGWGRLALAAVAVAAVARAIPWPSWLASAVAVVGGAGASWGLAQPLGITAAPWLAALGGGLIAALVALVATGGERMRENHGWRGMVLAGVLPTALSGAAIFYFSSIAGA